MSTLPPIGGILQCLWSITIHDSKHALILSCGVPEYRKTHKSLFHVIQMKHVSEGDHPQERSELNAQIGGKGKSGVILWL